MIHLEARLVLAIVGYLRLAVHVEVFPVARSAKVAGLLRSSDATSGRIKALAHLASRGVGAYSFVDKYFSVKLVAFYFLS